MFKKKKNQFFTGSYFFDGRNDESAREIRKREKSTITRMVALMGLITVFMCLIAIRLAYIQLNQSDYYQARLVVYKTASKNQDVPRGRIYDANGVLLVGSEAASVITYYAPSNITTAEEKAMAKIISNHFDLDLSSLTSRDIQDLVIRDFSDEVNKLISDEEWTKYKAGEIDDNGIYRLKLERITDEYINQVYSNSDLSIEESYIYSLMNKDPNGANVVIENASAEDIAFVGERSNLLRGFTYGQDYERVYPYGATFRSVFGKISTKTQGLPNDASTELLALGYEMDSRVGISGIEKQYESLLKGTKSTYNLTYDERGNAVIDSLTEGSRGYDLTLSIDWELQEYINNILETKLAASVKMNNNQYVDRMFFVLMDPNTGDVIAMCGKMIDRETGEIFDYADGVYSDAHEFGSSIKGATVYTGFRYGIYNAGEYIYDEPLYIKDTPTKASWTKAAMGNLTEATALARSSNVFMFKLALKLGGTEYVANQSINVDPAAFSKLQLAFGELGLGVKTGIDVPNESLGVSGGYTTPNDGNILDAVIGQYYTYTPIQMAQYVSTIANGGLRIQPRLVKEASTTVNGIRTTVYTNDVTILDDNTQYSTAFERIRYGFYLGVNDGSVGILTSLAKTNYTMAAKSGTAEKFTGDTDYPNKALIAFAPYENPRIASSCIVPREYTGSTCTDITGNIYDKYFEKYGLD